MVIERALRFAPHRELAGRANVVVDGAPTEGTTLALTHWPRFPVPRGLAADLSAEMAFAYLRDPRDLHAPAELVSNDHFDQDGLVSVYALSDPAGALARESRLVEVARAGDFGCTTDRAAARISAAIAAFTDPTSSPLGAAPDGADRCGWWYAELLQRLPELCDHPERFERLWRADDESFSRSTAAIEAGEVTLTEVPEVDLAVVDVPAGLDLGGGTRFTHQWFGGVHPMAVHNRTQALVVLVVHGGTFELTYRYESWVQFRSRPVRQRRDLRLLAEELTAGDPAGATWRFGMVSSLTPSLSLVDGIESGWSADQVVALVRRHLADRPPAWDPFGHA